MDDTEVLLADDELTQNDSKPQSNATNGPSATVAAEEKVGIKDIKREDLHNLFSRVRLELHIFIIAVIALFAAAGVALLIPKFVGEFVNAMLTLTSEQIRDNILKLLVASFATAFFGLIRSASLQIAGQRLVTRLREDLFNNLLNQEMGFFDQSRTGDLTSRLISDTASVQYAMTWNLSSFLANIVQAIGTITMMIITSWHLSLLLLGLIPIVALCAFLYGRFVGSLASKVQDKLAETSSFTEEVLANMQTVRSFAGENYSKKFHATRLWDVYKVLKKKALANALFEAFAGLVASLSIAGILWLGAYLVHSKTLEPGSLATYLFYSLACVGALNSLSGVYPVFMEAVGATRRIFVLLNRKPEVEYGALGIRPPAQFSGPIQFQQVSFSYPTRPNHKIVNDINLNIYPGKVLALVGSSGGGKTTIAKLLLGLYEPSQGKITIDGKDIATFDQHLWRRKFGVVNQEPTLFATSISKNICYALDFVSDADVETSNFLTNDISEEDVTTNQKQKEADEREICEKAAKAANALDFIKLLPDTFETNVGERGVRLSGGQKQRVAIARALSRDPSILILDEATSALDSESEHKVQQALDSLLEHCEGKYMIVIAHRLSTVMNAHEIVVMDKGSIVERGNHQELIQRGGRYKELVERQLSQSKGEQK